MEEQSLYTCCFFGHRKITKTDKLKDNLCKVIENLIENKKADTFLFGSKSEFDSLCLKTVTVLKEKYPHIKRIYVRAEFPDIDDGYKMYLLKYYDDTYFPEKIHRAGKASYIERNYEMIDNSKYCVIYYDKSYLPPQTKSGLVIHQPKSGTAVAYDYAVKKKKEIINVLN